MNSIKLLIDFGSTFTKVVAIDLDKEAIISTARVPSTVDNDITIGLEQALRKIADTTDLSDVEIREALACSSAAGGLRMVCIGFVPDLTSKAAYHAALGAGAKVIACYSYKLNDQELKEIEAIAPDILLLSGGTDGGDEQVIIHNAKMLTRCNHNLTNIIIAGNKTTYDDIKAIFKDSSKNIIFTQNVMPEIGILDVEPCNKEIRDIFIKNIIKAKGIAKVQSIIHGVIMPTPSAVLEAAKLIANGFNKCTGLGELVVIDVGGATTDIHSIARGEPQGKGITLAHSLPEPYVKRTVEGNLGLKHNIDTLSEFAKIMDNSPNFMDIVQRFHEGNLPKGEEETACHILLSQLAVEIAMNQHAGKIEVIYGPAGEMLIQHGKDLTNVNCVIGTGGPIVFSSNPSRVMEGALFKKTNPSILKPKHPKLYIDKHYILFAIGLLSQAEPEKALNIAMKYLKQVKRNELDIS